MPIAVTLIAAGILDAVGSEATAIANIRRRQSMNPRVDAQAIARVGILGVVFGVGLLEPDASSGTGGTRARPTLAYREAPLDGKPAADPVRPADVGTKAKTPARALLVRDLAIRLLVAPERARELLLKDLGSRVAALPDHKARVTRRHSFCLSGRVDGDGRGRHDGSGGNRIIGDCGGCLDGWNSENRTEPDGQQAKDDHLPKSDTSIH